MYYTFETIILKYEQNKIWFQMFGQIAYLIAIFTLIDDVQSTGTSLFKKYKTSQFNSLKTMNNIISMVWFKRINF